MTTVGRKATAAAGLAVFAIIGAVACSNHSSSKKNAISHRLRRMVHLHRPRFLDHDGPSRLLSMT